MSSPNQQPLDSLTHSLPVYYFTYFTHLPARFFFSWGVCLSAYVGSRASMCVRMCFYLSVCLCQENEVRDTNLRQRERNPPPTPFLFHFHYHPDRGHVWCGLVWSGGQMDRLDIRKWTENWKVTRREYIYICCVVFFCSRWLLVW